ncbi:hypothetical protein PC129_g23549 [Phytophthora cactorum]|nr:hypothetical protein Pcac1_g10284 [Phytophthora cactorum]KAG3201345.1 hypothetical protein PC129_g23549 [Phytophthora cactorum]KAG4226757.1 hypothetical protein PC116_g24848 [Phytophthora cactorum]RAW19750.1 hypothetical protein PC110_g23808 [Phytophthora cactorum]
MSAAGLGDDATAESSSPKPGRRGLHKPKDWKQKKASEDSSRVPVICSFPIKSKFESHKSSLAVVPPISVSHDVVYRSSEVSVTVGV